MVSERYFERIKERIAGKEIGIIGYARYNKLSFKVSPANVKTILEFDKELALNGGSLSHRKNMVIELGKFATFLQDKPFKKATKNDIKHYMETLKPIEVTRVRIALKFFYRKLYDMKTNHYPECIDWLEAKSPKRDTRQPVLSVDDIQRLTEAAGNLRDKMIIQVLYEAGLRVSELLSIQMKHLEFDKDGGAYMTIYGKTGQRRIWIKNSVPFIKNFITVHPEPNNPESYLIISRQDSRGLNPTYRNKRVEHIQIIIKVVKRLCKRCGLPPYSTHIFRRSRATHLSRRLTDQQMKPLFGWSKQSNMPSHYSQITNDNVIDDVRLMYGEDVKIESLVAKEKTCAKCGHSMTPDAKFCSDCGFIMDVSVLAKDNIADQLRKVAEMYSIISNLSEEDIIKLHKKKKSI